MREIERSEGDQEVEAAFSLSLSLFRKTGECEGAHMLVSCSDTRSATASYDSRMKVLFLQIRLSRGRVPKQGSVPAAATVVLPCSQTRRPEEDKRR